MANLNKVFLIGRLTADPELRYTQTGTAVADIRLAINRSYRTQGGESKEDTCFVDVVLWARQAEIVKKYVTKGRPIFIEGRLKLDSWESKDGDKRSRLRVVAENFQFIGGREDMGTERFNVMSEGGGAASGSASQASYGQGKQSGERRAAPGALPPPEEFAEEFDFPDDNMPF